MPEKKMKSKDLNDLNFKKKMIKHCARMKGFRPENLTDTHINISGDGNTVNNDNGGLREHSENDVSDIPKKVPDSGWTIPSQFETNSRQGLSDDPYSQQLNQIKADMKKKSRI